MRQVRNGGALLAVQCLQCTDRAVGGAHAGFIATRLDDKAQASSLSILNPEGPYGGCARISEWVHRTEGISKGTPPGVFASNFVNMALSPRAPPPHWISGKLSWFVWLLGCVAPHWLMDRLYAQASGLDELAAAIGKQQRAAAAVVAS